MQGRVGVFTGTLIAKDRPSTEAERVVDLYEEDPPIWYPDRRPLMNECPCDHEGEHTSVENLLGAHFLPVSVVDLKSSTTVQ